VASDAQVELIEEVASKGDDIAGMIQVTKGAARGFKDSGNVGCPCDELIDAESDEEEVGVKDPPEDGLDFRGGAFSQELCGLH
jgi:hypothetical protein